MSQSFVRAALIATSGAALLATAGCGDSAPGDAAAPATKEPYPLADVCIYDPNNGREICGQEGADWCKTYVAERDKVRADENDVDATEIGCEAFEG